MTTMISELVARSRSGEVRALARLLTLLEGEWEAGASEALPLLAPHAGRAHRIGVTGPPGAGKSTLVDRLVGAFREAGERVAVLAFDPSSPFTGGALLGDRVRMGDRALDPGVYIRSVANRAHAGGLSRTAARLVTALDATGFDRILLETVGAGQSEVDVAGLAQTVLVVLAPGFGDEIQALKAGLLETADLLVVNKADLPGADRVVAALQHTAHGAQHTARNAAGQPDTTGAVSLSPGGEPACAQGCAPRAVRCLLKVSATSGEGVAELTEAIRSHAAALRASGDWDARRRAQAGELLEEAVRERLWRRFQAERAAELSQALDQVRAGSLDPESAAAMLVDEESARCSVLGARTDKGDG
jgi:LAO/AO transport system kinase